MLALRFSVEIREGIPRSHYKIAEPSRLSLSEAWSGWYERPNRAMLPSHERSLQSGLVGAGLVVMVRRRGPPSQGWKTSHRNHADGIVAMDLFVVPTISFRLLYALLIMGHGRRQILWFRVTAHPTTEWIANQLTEACGWQQIPRNLLIRDRDRAYGEIFVCRARSIGIRDRPTSFRSPCKTPTQNG